MSLELFDFNNYRKYLRAYLKSLPNQGYGQLAKIARAISLNPSTLTLVLHGDKDFTAEQALDLCENLEFTELETEYFLALVSYSRAGKPNLRERILKQLEKIRARSKELKDRLPPKAELTEETRAVFYSQWYYSAIRLLTSIDGFHSVDSMSARLGLPRQKVKAVVEFLLATGLCIEQDGTIHMGPQSTHLGADSMLVGRHHQNWRFKSIERTESLSTDELLFTSPISISRAAMPEVRKILMRAIEESFKIIDPSPCEELACINIDLFRF